MAPGARRAAEHRSQPPRRSRLDLPGHGGSVDGAPYGPYTARDAVVAAVEAAGLVAPVVVGHSYSAILAVFYAATFPTSGIVSVDQTLQVGPFAAVLRAHADTLRGPDYLEVWRELEAGLHIEVLPDDAQQLLRASCTPRQELLLGYWSPILDQDPRELHDELTDAIGAVRDAQLPFTLVAGSEPGPDARAWMDARAPRVDDDRVDRQRPFPAARPTRSVRTVAREHRALARTFTRRSTMSTRTVLTCVLACALTLAAAACGSSKSNTSLAPTTTATAPAATAPTASTASGATAPTTPATAPAGASSESDAGFCKLGGPANPALAFAAVTEGAADVGELRHDLARAEAQAPGEIKADVQTIADVEVPILDGKVGQTQIQQELADPRIVAAMRHISSWSVAHCNQ